MAISLKPAHLKRYKDIAWLLVKYGRGDLGAGLREDLTEAQRVSSAGVPRAEEFASDLEKLGPTFVKIGQLLSTRADLLPPPYLEALSRLQDSVAPFSVCRGGRDRHGRAGSPDLQGLRRVRARARGRGLARTGAPGAAARRASRRRQGAASRHPRADSRGPRSFRRSRRAGGSARGDGRTSAGGNGRGISQGADGRARLRAGGAQPRADRGKPRRVREDRRAAARRGLHDAPCADDGPGAGTEGDGLQSPDAPRNRRERARRRALPRLPEADPDRRLLPRRSRTRATSS